MLKTKPLMVRMTPDSIARFDLVAERLGLKRATLLRACAESIVSHGEAGLPLDFRKVFSDLDGRRLRRPGAGVTAAAYFGSPVDVLRRVVLGAAVGTDMQFEFFGETDSNKPDLVVRLPGGRNVIVDAKAASKFPSNPDTAASADVSGQEKAYAAGLKRAVNDRPDYSAEYPDALNHIVFFLPDEGVLSAALVADPDLISAAANHGVTFATPASLRLILQAFAMIWRNQAVADSAREITATVQALSARLARFTRDVADIQGRLEQAVSVKPIDVKESSPVNQAAQT